MDTRVDQLARLLVEHSTALKSGDKVLIEATGTKTFPLVDRLVQVAYEKKAYPYVRLHDERIFRAMLMGAEDDQFEVLGGVDRSLMEQMDAYIGVRGAENVLELSDVPTERMKIYSRWILQHVHFDIRVPKTRWAILRFPSPSFAQAAKMSSAAFEEFFFASCLVDYAKMDKDMDPLKDLMDKTDMVKITGPGTDVSFSIKGIPAIKCAGEYNIPDGEVFTAPVMDSANGVIAYNTPTLYQGSYFDGVTLTFKNGKIVDATCAQGDVQRLNDILDRDDGARYVGEFALGCNPVIREPMLDILFDEKISGSFHFTPGASYEEAPNGNDSQVHWDMVCRQFKHQGGGEIYFDGVLIRKDGMFVLPELEALNPPE